MILHIFNAEYREVAIQSKRAAPEPPARMEPFSIYELTTTVLKVSYELYSFLKAVHDAPSEVQEYLEALESTRKVLVGVQEHAADYERSDSLHTERSQLQILRAVLKECEISFTLQLSNLEDSHQKFEGAMFERIRKKVEFVLSKDAIKQSTKKLRASQNLLAQAVTTLVGFVHHLVQ